MGKTYMWHTSRALCRLVSNQHFVRIHLFDNSPIKHAAVVLSSLPFPFKWAGASFWSLPRNGWHDSGSARAEQCCITMWTPLTIGKEARLAHFTRPNPLSRRNQNGGWDRWDKLSGGHQKTPVLQAMDSRRGVSIIRWTDWCWRVVPLVQSWTG